MTLYANKPNAVRAARKELGSEATPGVDFNLIPETQPAGTYYRWEVPTKKGKAAAPAPAPQEPAKAPRAVVKTVRSFADHEPQVSLGQRKTAMRPKATRPAKPELGTYMPEPPVFVSASAKPYQRRLDPLIAMAKAKDVAGLRAASVDAACKDGRVAAMGRYRDAVVAYLEAQASKKKA